MHRLLLAGIVAVVLGVSRPAAAHPVPFSFVDIHVQPATLELTLVVHVFDLAHDLGIAPMERLFEPAVLTERAGAIRTLLEPRLKIASDGRPLRISEWSAPEALPERQSLRFQVRLGAQGPAGVVGVTASMFPYDPQHQTFLNFYEKDQLATQAILDSDHTSFDYYTGTRQGILAVIQRFVPSGIHHILVGPDHLLFLIGLLLVGGSLRQLAVMVTAFTLAHSITLSLAALNVFSPPARIVEPAIALSIVYVGADNLLVRGGRDMRGWIAFAFGFVHGFGFAYVLRDMGLPSQALGWTLFSFNLGVEIGQLAVVVAVASALAALRARSEAAGRRLAVAGSIVVIVTGAYWFIQRVFFPGGMA